MSEHPRTEKARNEAFDQWKKDSLVANKKCEDEISLVEYTGKALDNLCREMEWELNHFNAVDAEYRDLLREVASDAKQDIRILDWLLDNAAVQTGEDGNNYFIMPLIPATFCTAPLGKREAIIKEMENQQTK